MTSPDGEIPNGMYTFPVNTGETAPEDVDWWADQTEADWRSKINGGFTSSFNPIGGWASGLLNALMGVFTGASTILQGISYVLGLRWDQVDNHDAAIVDLQDQTQVLEGVIGHGTRYMSTSPGVTTSPKTMPFDVRVGPLVGVTLQSGGKFRLDSKGLWDFHAQCEFTGGFLCPPEVYMDIVVRNPAGVEVGRRKAKGSSQDPVTVYNYYSYTIPSAGYTVEIQAWTASLPALGNWRGISGGLQTTGFSARKISAEVD